MLQSEKFLICLTDINYNWIFSVFLKLNEPLSFAGLWCRDKSSTTLDSLSFVISTADPNVMYPFGGYYEKYEICTPSVWFETFALATGTDYNFIKSKCEFGNRVTEAKKLVSVIDPYKDNISAVILPDAEHRRALRVYTETEGVFAPGDISVKGGSDLSYPYEYNYWSFPVTFWRDTSESKNYGKMYDDTKCTRSNIIVI